MPIRIVTDSTCDIPEETAAAYGITVVPAYVNIGDESYLDGLELSRSDFYEMLPGLHSPPTTAAPAPGAFAETYNRLADEGATEILSIHVAASLSAMLNAARVGADSTDAAKVTLFDSQQVTMGLGLLAISAARDATAGCTMEEIVARLKGRVGRTYVLGLLDTLEYLRRSGRVNWAQFGIGTVLRIKPLVKVYLGEVDMLDKVRSSKRALQRFLALAVELGPLEELSLLQIGASNEKIDSLRRQTEFLVPAGQTPLEVELTPALGAHIGPGGLGIACITANGDK
jgi:DegV family protein with EDD domain